MRDNRQKIVKLSIVQLLFAIFVPTIIASSKQKKKIMMCEEEKIHKPAHEQICARM